MDPSQMLEVCRQASQAIATALSTLDDWGEAGTIAGQHHCDLVADRVGVQILLDAGFKVLSEESGIHEQGRSLTAVIDPVDGSTNASHGIPWYATSICILDDVGPLVGLVVNQASGVSYEAVRGEGARRDGKPIAPSGATKLGDSLVALSGYPPSYLGWRQYRAFGAAALDLCAVADGSIDGYLDCNGAHAPWDYLGAMLICQEAGATIKDVSDRDLVVIEHAARRAPVAGATSELTNELAAAILKTKSH